MVKLCDVCESISDGDHQPPPKSPEGVPFITISNVTDNRISFENTFRVPREYFDAIKGSRKPKVGDILYTVTGSFGIPVLVAHSTEFCFQRHIALLRPSSEKISSEFLFQLLKSSGVTQQAERMATGIAQKTVALKSLRDFSIPLPPLAIQKEIVVEIEGYQKRIQELQQEIADNEARIKTTIDRVWGSSE